MNTFDSTVRAVLILNACDRADAAARRHPVKGTLLRFLDWTADAIRRIQLKLIGDINV